MPGSREREQMKHTRSWYSQGRDVLPLGEIEGPASDPLPERAQYRDDGCPEVAPSCLNCPLPVCKADMPPKAAVTFLRERALMTILASGKSVDEAAALLHISRRSYFRLKRFVRHRAYGLPVPA